MNAVSGFQSSYTAASMPSYNPGNNHGPDDVPDEFGQGRGQDTGPDAVYDEFVPSRGDSSYSSYDSWSSYDSGGTTYGAMF